MAGTPIGTQRITCPLCGRLGEPERMGLGAEPLEVTIEVAVMGRTPRGHTIWERKEPTHEVLEAMLACAQEQVRRLAAMLGADDE